MRAHRPHGVVTESDHPRVRAWKADDAVYLPRGEHLHVELRHPTGSVLEVRILQVHPEAFEEELDPRLHLLDVTLHISLTIFSVPSGFVATSTWMSHPLAAHGLRMLSMCTDICRCSSANSCMFVSSFNGSFT